MAPPSDPAEGAGAALPMPQFQHEGTEEAGAVSLPVFMILQFYNEECHQKSPANYSNSSSAEA